MLKNIKNNKGWAMPIVIVIVTVLVIITVALLNNIVQSYHYVGSQDNIGNTYLAGDAALDRWFNVLSNEVEAKGNDFSLNYTGNPDMTNPSNVQQFAQYIISEIENYLNNNGYKVQNVDIEGVSNDATVEIESINNMGYEIIGDELRLIIGIQATAKYSKASYRYKAFDKKVYGQMEFKFKLPEDPKFKLLGPVYSFGDFFVDGAEVNIKGDTYVFGSFPEEIAQPQQWYYGGIFALNQANLTIDGNAYSRSFIRTGKYLQDNDNSWIRITKDAICQAIQLFGDGDRVLVYRNAYTFDDLEVNGEDSVIGINGSFIGLSKGGKYHDESSAIVNSAAIHNIYSPASFKSRIIVNGDNLNRGGTFKILDNGVSVGQIEDASIAWDNNGSFGGNAYYKTFKGNFLNEYHDWLIMDSNTPGRIKGYFNLFQVWGVKPKGIVNDWFVNYALAARTEMGNNSNLFDYTVPEKISGYWEHEIVGNDKVYNSFYSLYRDTLGMKPLEHLYNTNDEYKFVLDNIYGADRSKLKYGNNAWYSLSSSNLDLVNVFDDETERYDKYIDVLDLLIQGIDRTGDKITSDCIHDDLLKLTHFFATRTYPSSREIGAKWDVGTTETFRETLVDLNGLAVSPTLGDEQKEYILNVSGLPGPYDTNIVHDINDLYNDYYNIVYGVPGSLYNKRSADLLNDAEDKYYLVINSDPNIDLAVSGVFNGIIFTAGKVYLRDGADIRGAIIAAGKTKSNGDPDLDYITVKDDNDVNHAKIGLNNGGKAAIFVEKNANVKIDFYLGYKPYDDFGIGERVDTLNRTSDIDTNNDFLSRAARVRLLKRFKDQGIDLTDIF